MLTKSSIFTLIFLIAFTFYGSYIVDSVGYQIEKTTDVVELIKLNSNLVKYATATTTITILAALYLVVLHIDKKLTK
jgi:hypothetical protein